MNARVAAAGLTAVVLVASCGSKRAEVDLAAARAAVEAYFIAADAKDCTTVMRMMPSVKSLADCAEYLGQWHEDSTQLLRVVEVTRDSRDPNAAIVLVQLSENKGAREIRIRVQRGPAGFSIVF